MFKCIALLAMFVLCGWVFVGFIDLEMYTPAALAGISMFVVTWVAANECADAFAYWDCMR